MLHEERTANILINKAGGNAGPDANGYRVALPSAWMKALGISEGSRTVTLQFDGESITIRRPAVSDYDAFLANARSSAHALLILYYYGGEEGNDETRSRSGATSFSSIRLRTMTEPS